MNKSLRVLIVEDSEADTELLVRELRRGGYEPVFKRVETSEAMSGALDGESWDVVISDHAMPRFSSKGALQLLQRRQLDVPLIIVSGSIGEGAAVTMMKAGASDYIMKDDLLRLVPAVEREILDATGRRERRKAEEALRRSQAQIRRLVDSNVLGVMVANTDGGITEANDAFLQMVGFSREELLAGEIRWDRMTPPEWRKTDERILRQVREGGVALPVEKEYFRKDGTRVPILLGAAAWEEIRGDLKCVCFALDLTRQKQADEQLRLQSAALTATANGIVITDRAGSIQWVNPAFTLISGYTAEEVIGKNPRLLKSGRQDAAFYRAFWETILRGATWRGEFINRRKDGSLYHNEHTVTPVGSADGEITHFIGIMRDVTERKRLEEERERLIKDRLLLLESVAEGIYGIDLEARCTFVNPAAARMLGYTADELLGKDIHALVHHHRADGSEYPIEECPIVRASREQQGCRVDTEVFWRRDGTAFPVEYSSHPIREGDRTVGAVVSLMDISLRKRAEEQLREQARLLDLAQDAILVCDLEHRVLYWNQGAERLYGWTAAEAVGRPVTELIYRDTAPFETAWQELAGKGEWHGELHQVTQSGQTVVVNSRWNLVAGAPGKPASILAINTDVTEKKQLETQFLRTQRLESVGTLASGIAHDLNNVLAPILMSTQLLRTKALDEEGNKIVATIETSAQRGAGIVKQVLTFARGAEGEHLALQLEHLVRDTIHMTRHTFPKSITVRTQTAPGLWPVTGDATQLSQVLLNLCVNARDAMPEGGRLEISAANVDVDESYASMVARANTGPHVQLDVRDTGAGIEPAILDKIFDPFFTTKGLGKGTGLGLSTVLGIVRSHGGFINVTSVVGTGTTFSVFLPATPRAEVAEGDTARTRLPRGRGELVLVVDDEVAVREVTQRVLERFGYAAVTTGDGIEALAVFAQRLGAVQLVLTDVVMPNMDGIALVRVLRKMEPKLKIIASSGAADSGDETSRAAELEALKVDAILPKPYLAEQLLATLRALLHPGGKSVEGEATRTEGKRAAS